MTYTSPSRDATIFVVSLNFPAELGGLVRVPGNVTGLSETVGQRQITRQRQTDGGTRVLLGEDPEMTITIDAETIPSSAQLHYLQSLRHSPRTIPLGIRRPEVDLGSTAATVAIARNGACTFAGDVEHPVGAFPGVCIQPTAGDDSGKNYEILKIIEKADGANKALLLPASSDRISDNDVEVFRGVTPGSQLGAAIAATAYKIVLPATRLASLNADGSAVIGDVACRVSQSPSLGSSQRGPDVKISGQIVLAAEGEYTEEVVNRGA